MDIQQNLESVMQAKGKVFLDVAKTLEEIKDRELYREQGYATFGEYCERRWGMSRITVYEHLRLAKVIENLRTLAPTRPLPTKVKVGTELAKLAPYEQAKIAEAIDLASSPVQVVLDEVRKILEKQSSVAGSLDPLAPLPRDQRRTLTGLVFKPGLKSIAISILPRSFEVRTSWEDKPSERAVVSTSTAALAAFLSPNDAGTP